MNPYVIAADIGGSHISSTLLNTQDWTLTDKAIIETKTNSFANKNIILESWANNLQQSARLRKITGRLQIAIALPGPFDYKKGVFQAHPEGKMGSLVGENFKTLLAPYFEEELTMVFENDAACFGLGEAHFGLSKGYTKSIGITLGTGIGSSFVANGRLVKTGKGIPIGGELYAEPFGESIADDYFSTRWFVAKAYADLGLIVSGLRELLAAAPSAYLPIIFEEFSQQLYEFLFPFAQNFGAKIIVVGGNIAKAWPYFGQTLSRLFAAKGIAVQPSLLNEKAIMLGVAKVFVDTFEQ